MTYSHNPLPPIKSTKTNQDKIKELCARLGGSLDTPPNDEHVLDGQVQILNALFHTTLAEQLHVTKQKCGEKRAMEWLKIALQIQRQCAETLRTRKTIDYMDNLNSVSLNAPKNVY